MSAWRPRLTSDVDERRRDEKPRAGGAERLIMLEPDLSRVGQGVEVVDDPSRLTRHLAEQVAPAPRDARRSAPAIRRPRLQQTRDSPALLVILDEPLESERAEGADRPPILVAPGQAARPNASPGWRPARRSVRRRSAALPDGRSLSCGAADRRPGMLPATSDSRGTRGRGRRSMVDRA